MDNNIIMTFVDFKLSPVKLLRLFEETRSHNPLKKEEIKEISLKRINYLIGKKILDMSHSSNWLKWKQVDMIKKVIL
jgi:hypothetical protein